MPQELKASGSALAQSLSALSIETKRRYALTASGAARASGSALAANRVLPAGGMTDFGVWASTQPDTAMTRDLSRSVGTDATASRGWLTASAPTEYRRNGGPVLWNAAVYAGIGIKWAGVPSGQKQSFHQAQMELARSTENRLSWDATSWESRGCYTAQSNAQWCTVETTTEAAFSGMHAGKITYSGAVANEWGYWIIPVPSIGMAACTPGEKLNGSVSVRMNRAAWWTAALYFYDANYVQIGTFRYSEYKQHPGNGKWDTSRVYTQVVPANAVWVAVVPRISVNSTPAATDSVATVGEVAFCDMHRIWSSPYNVAGTPTSYKSPKKLTIDVKAKRVNYLNNPGFDVDMRGWGAFGTGNAPFPASVDTAVGRQKAGSLRFSVAGNIASTAMGVSGRIGVGTLRAWSTNSVGGGGLKPSTKYMVSAYVKLGQKCPPVTLGFLSTHTVLSGVTSTRDAENNPALVESGWVRLWALIRTAEGDDGVVYANLGVNTADVTAGGVPISFWVDDALVEDGDQLLPYFDGNSPGSDYLWSGTPGYSSSHYYPEFRANAYRLRDIVQAQVPHGTQIDIRYARPPR
ncbi:hypothetical protein [Streptomyces luteogriseus]|uniref:hypothetical protein n=1 Tax=Streptomyces luteogriseus TaxID=68233 RepID=UPI0037B8BE12